MVEEGETLGSDHQVIELHINRELMTRNSIRYSTKKFNTDKIKQKDFEAWLRIKEEDLKENITNAETAMEKYEIFMNSITEGIEQVIGEGGKRETEITERERVGINMGNNNNRRETKENHHKQFPWWDEVCMEGKTMRKGGSKKTS